MAPKQPSRPDAVSLGSDRSFGLVFAAFFAVLGALPLLSGEAPRPWSFGVAALLLVVALVVPRSLHPLNVAWAFLGLALHRVATPVVLGLIYTLMIAPTGILMRQLGKNPLALGFQPLIESYWIPRQPPAPAPDSLHRQF